MNQMNPDQSAAVKHLTGPMIVIAPPGSGKTFILTNRIKHLVDECGVDPSSVLVITFTRAASSEMKQRYLRLMNAEQTAVTFGTFHSVYYMILRTSFGVSAGAVLSESDKVFLLDSILRAVALEEEEKPDVETLIAEISRMKNLRIQPDQYECSLMDTHLFKTIVKRYEQAKTNRGKLDYDDLITKCRDSLLTHPETLKLWQKKYQYILIDEFQDINPAQYEIVRMIGQSGNVFAVGDDDQSIYGFRGSKPQLMLGLDKDYADLQKVYLKTNYRSCKEIIDVAGRLIRHNTNRFDKTILPFESGSGSVQFMSCKDMKMQDALILEKIREWNMVQDTAIIVRTNTGISKYAQLLLSNGIEYVAKDKVKNPFKNPLIGDIMSYLRLAGGTGSRNDLIRIIGKPYRHVSRSAIPESGSGLEVLDRLIELYGKDLQAREALRQLKNHLTMMRGMNIYASLNYIRLGIQYGEYLKVKYLDKGFEQQYEEAVSLFELLQQQGRNLKDLYSLEERLHVLEKEYADRENERRNNKGVTLITMHGSKGLEYENVIIPDLNENQIPGRHAFLPDEIEEERRILYVAMTRAKRNLFLSGVHQKGDQSKELSRFTADFLPL